MPKQEPQRSCLGCRTSKDKKDLLRFVLSPERELVPDLLSRLPGRGAYTCLSRICLKAALEKKQFNRAFKGEVTSGRPDEVAARITAMIEERLGSYLSLANKAGKVVSGSDMVMEALRKEQVGVVFITRDISVDIGEKVVHTAGRVGTVVVRLLDKERLGGLLGKELRSAAAIEKGGFADTVVKELVKYRNFFEGGTQER